MRIRWVMVVFILALLLPVSADNALCQDPQKSTASFQNIDALLAQGENQQAWELLQEVPEDESTTADKLWRMARTQYEMGRLADKDISTFFKKAEMFARESIEKNPDNSESYKWLAIVLGAQSKHSDTKDQIRQSREIKYNIEKAISLNPDDDISYLVLSRWHYKVSALGGVARTFAKIIYGEIPKASLEKAEELILQAIKLHDRVSHRYNLAKIYNRMDREAEMLEQYRLTLLLPVTFPEEAKEKDKARKKLQNWEQKQ